MQRIGVVLIQPVVAVEEEELLAPEHAGESLPHYLGRVFTDRRRRDGIVEFIGFTDPVGEDIIKRPSEWLDLLVQETAGEPQANHCGRSEERRVGKECRTGWWTYHE